MDDFWAQFEAYVRSYLPEWHFQKGGPELEAALMTAMGELLEESRGRLERLPEKHEREFLRPWLGEPQASTPMYAYAALHAPRSVPVSKGSPLYRSGNGTQIWETAEEAWAEPAQLAEMVLAGGPSGKLIRLSLPTPGQPVKLFDLQAPGMQKREVIFRHPHAFASQTGCQVSLHLDGTSERMLQFLQDPDRVSWFLMEPEKAVPVPPPACTDGKLQFTLPPAPGGSALSVQAKDGQIPPPAAVRKVDASLSRGPSGQFHIVTDAGYTQGCTWFPFGTQLTLWNCCYFSCPDVICLPGARLTLSWTRSIQIRDDILPGMDQTPEYRPVMRRMPPSPPKPRDVNADTILWEYWDGSVWRMIPGTEPYACLFSDRGETGHNTKDMEASFTLPADAVRCEIQGLDSYWLRWRLCACDGAGWLPARYHIPEISDLRVSAELAGAELSVERCCGLTEHIDILTGNQKILFPPITPEQDTLWLGFDSPPGGENANLYLTLRGRAPGRRLTAWEATSEGNKTPLTLVDGTDGLAHSGVLTLGDVTGRTTIRFGSNRWWIALRDEYGPPEAGRLPVLQQLDCGVVLLRSADSDVCMPNDPFLPLRGGMVSGTALTESFGGVQEETDQDIIHRARQERHHLGRAVSSLDVNQLICGTIRSAVRTRCIRDGETLFVGVLMRDVTHHADAFALKKDEIHQLLIQASALPSLGVTVQVREPNFYPIHVMVWLQIPLGGDYTESKRKIKIALNRFLHSATGNFHGQGWRIGTLPTVAQIRNCLQSAAPDVKLVELVCATTTPEGLERELTAIHDPFAVPIGGAYTIHEMKGGHRK